MEMLLGRPQKPEPWVHEDHLAPSLRTNLCSYANSTRPLI